MTSTVQQDLRELRDTTEDPEVKRIARKALNEIEDLKLKLREAHTLAQVLVKSTADN